MKHPTTTLLLLLATLALPARADSYHQLTVRSNTSSEVISNEFVNLAAGERAVVETLLLSNTNNTNQPASGGTARLEIRINSVFHFIDAAVTNSTKVYPEFGRTMVVGPARIGIRATGVAGQTVANAFAVIRVMTDADEAGMVPNNTAVIPTDATGNANVILESSNDLVNWNPANPGTYDTATAPRFFRTRIEITP